MDIVHYTLKIYCKFIVFTGFSKILKSWMLEVGTASSRDTGKCQVLIYRTSLTAKIATKHIDLKVLKLYGQV